MCTARSSRVCRGSRSWATTISATPTPAALARLSRRASSALRRRHTSRLAAARSRTLFSTRPCSPCVFVCMWLAVWLAVWWDTHLCRLSGGWECGRCGRRLAGGGLGRQRCLDPSARCQGAPGCSCMGANLALSSGLDACIEHPDMGGPHFRISSSSGAQGVVGVA